MNSLNALMQQEGLLGTSNVSLGLILASILLSFALGVAIAYVYKKTHSGFSYARSFLFTLIIVTIVISLIMMIIQSNVALSLGLVGSLSVIRFRTVLKDTKDMAYLFWVICIGLAVGSGNYMLALVATISISLIVFYLEKVNFGKNAASDYIMVLQAKSNSNGDITKLFNKLRIKWEIRSSLLDQENATKETRYSIFSKLKPKEVEDLMNETRHIEGVTKVSLLSPETNLYV